MVQPSTTKVLKKCQMTVSGDHKDLSYSYGKGIDKKKESMAQPYKTKALKKQLLKKKTLPFFLINLYYINIEFDQLFSKPSFYMAEPYMSIFRLCPPYKNLTCPYGPQKPSCDIFSKAFLFYG